ncbi:acyl-CoA dehydratase activase-related protein, partial [Thermodesulfobacteriota bacterium]
DLFRTEIASFDMLIPLKDFEDRVSFKTIEKGIVRKGDECILGLDVGSTTTKAVLLRKSDDAILASIYLRTDGDPVGASRQCYRSIFDQIKAIVDPSQISIEGLGVCGSGRQIAGLHALTEGVINEIIAHATAAVHFDPQVDTIFEIGGQDAKYTYITNGVPSDYAMNEACSAGTGSFLEESAYETLGVNMTDIAGIAIRGNHPPNFNDQCAAFISSDIKNAIHEGVAHEDIVAGLVYSICMNYANRVKGNRPVGEKVYMQGGVCYNRAVPLAMAALVGKPIIVPPEPGLMGAYGVALEMKKRIEKGLLEKRAFDLYTLINREVEYKKSFICPGGKENCDRRCDISMIQIDEKTYPFGGACNRYYNLRRQIKYDVEGLDLVRVRQQLVFERYGVKPNQIKKDKQRGTIGFNRSFMTNTYYPLYSHFFSELGFEPVLPDEASQEGIDQRNAAFCYPVELAHGFFYSLICREELPNYLFLPHFKAILLPKSGDNSQVCPLVQGEPFYLQSTFKNELDALLKKGIKVLSPRIDFKDGPMAAEKPLLETAKKMGIGLREAKQAFEKAIQKQLDCMSEMKQIGKKALNELKADPEKIGVIIFARPYNGFVDEAHMGIPHKLASRGVMVLPFDFLEFDEQPSKDHMYWGMGHLILQAARIVKENPQLFGTYITNFACGPDSFLVGYFRELMGRKPSLTLELDNHTADAGIETRIEAFLDIISAYRRLVAEKKIVQKTSRFEPARTVFDNGTAMVVASNGEMFPMTDPRVTVLFPSMGELSAESLASIFRGKGFNAKMHRPADEAVLKLGRANTYCKECLPLILTTGTLLDYIQNEKLDDEILVYFMPTGSGPCRFGQYAVFMEDLVKRFEIPNVAMFSLTCENSYNGLGSDFQVRGWWAVVVSDVLEDIRSMLLAGSADPESAMEVFYDACSRIMNAMERNDFSLLEKRLDQAADRFSRIPMKRSPREIPTVALIGEIFVRRDSLSRQFLTERLAKNGFAAVCSPVAEWLLYADYMVDKGFNYYKVAGLERLKFLIKKFYMTRYEKRIKSAFSRSGLLHLEPLNIKKIINIADRYISPHLAGEAVLTVGSALSEIVSHACGVISIGPFGCMPNRLSESILNEAMNAENKLLTDPKNKALRTILNDMEDLPFLSIESDGSPFPQIIEAKLEAFFVRAKRLHERIIEVNKSTFY